MIRSTRVLMMCAIAAVALTGCDTARSLNPFSEKDKILPGERRPVFAPGDNFAGPRRLPPPNADAQGATIPATR